jgi:hypothetical protein
MDKAFVPFESLLEWESFEKAYVRSVRLGHLKYLVLVKMADSPFRLHAFVTEPQSRVLGAALVIKIEHQIAVGKRSSIRFRLNARFLVATR